MKTSVLTASALLAGAVHLNATISVMPDDSTTDSYWRTNAIGDIDGDKEYGTDGYILYGWNTPAGTYNTSFDASTANAENLWVPPAYIADITSATANRLWSGSTDGNYGKLQDPANSNTLHQAAVLLSASGTSSGDVTLTITRATSQAFRLTLIIGGGNGGANLSDTQNIQVDAGAAGSALGFDTGLNVVGVSYKSFDIDAGTDPITVTVNGGGVGDNTHLTGLAFDHSTSPPPPVAPVVSLQPVGGTVVESNSFSFVVAATGTAPSYQWYRGTNLLTDATNSILTLNPVTVADAGSYSVVLSNTAGQVTSAAAVLNVIAASSVQFVGTDTNTLAGWRTTSVIKPLDADGDNLYGSDGWVIYGYSVSGFQGTYAASSTGASLPGYIASVSNPPECWGGGATANYGVIDDPLNPGSTRNATIGFSPSGSTLSLTITRSTSHAFRLAVMVGNDPTTGSEEDITVNAGGQDMVHHVGSTTDAVATYHLFDIGAGVAPVIVSVNNAVGDNPGLMGFAFDSPVAQPPAITQQPVGGTFLAGAHLQMGVQASGTGPVTYLWFKDNVPIPGATNALLAFASLAATNAGSYQATVSNSGGSALSGSVSVSVQPTPTKLARFQTALTQTPNLISYYPFDFLTANDAVGQNPGALPGTAVFDTGVGGGGDKAVLLNGAGNVSLGQVSDFDFISGTGTVQLWLRADWTASPGYNPCIFAARNGSSVNYSIYLRDTKSFIDFYNGSSVSSIPVFAAGTNWHYLAVVFDGGAWTVYWDGQLAGTASQFFGSATDAPTQLGSSSPVTSEGWIGALDEVAFFSTALSASTIQALYAAYAVGDPPVIQVQPQGGSFLGGESVQLQALATGAGLSYQWFKNGSPLAGATNSMLLLPGVAATDSGTYRVTVTNLAGSATSADATVYVIVQQLGAYQAAVRSESSLISYYTFDNDDANDSQGTNNGTLIGGTSFGPGVGNGTDQSLMLDGTGFVTFGEVSDFDFTNGLGTVELWLRADWTNDPGYNPCIVADRDGSVVNYSIHLRAAKDTIDYYNGSSVASVGIPNAGQYWHHLAVTFATNTWSVYWDGALAGTAQQPFGPHPEAPTQLGSSAAGGAEFWIGALDEAAFYRTALSSSAIGRHYLDMGPPRLSAVPSGKKLTVSWDPSYSGWLLESSDRLPATSWSGVQGVASNSVTVDITGGTGFYRLRKP